MYKNPRYVPGTKMSLVPKCPWYRNVPGTETSLVPKRPRYRNVPVPKCLWDRNVPVPKCPWYRNVPVPKCLWGRNVPGPKCTWYRNVPVPKCLWDRNVRTEMSHAEKSGTEMWNSHQITVYIFLWVFFILCSFFHFFVFLTLHYLDKNFQIPVFRGSCCGLMALLVGLRVKKQLHPSPNREVRKVFEHTLETKICQLLCLNDTIISFIDA